MSAPDSPPPGTSADATAAAAISDTERSPRCRVIAYHEESSTMTALADGGEITIGRSREASITVASTEISRVHAAVRREGDAVWVRDLDSRNGTFVDGQRVESETLVPPGASIRTGPATILVAGLGPPLRRPPHELATLTELTSRLEAECERSRTTNRPVGVIALRLDGAEEAVANGTRALRPTLRPFDCLASYRPRELCVLRPEDGYAEIQIAAEAMLAAVATVPGARCVAGTAVHPLDGRNAGALLSAARDAMRTAADGEKSVIAASRAHLSATTAFTPIVADLRTRQLFRLARQVAASPLNVLLIGETGSGKEVVARDLHRAGGRSGPLVAVNCAALPESLLESTLFGHEKGAFTGAQSRHIGFFERAVGGTLFLDEIGDLGPDMQVKLLRSIDRKAIVRVGGTEEIAVDIRLVTATHRDLEADVGAGMFREDLWYRLSTFVLHVPPLRERTDDIEPLAQRFAEEIAEQLGVEPPEIENDALEALQSHGWPGNIRELKNVIERAVVLTGGDAIAAQHLPEPLSASLLAGTSVAAPDAVADRIAKLERTAIGEALAACGGNQTRAAKMLGITRRALIYRMEKYGFKRPPAGSDQKDGSGT